MLAYFSAKLHLANEYIKYNIYLYINRYRVYVVAAGVDVSLFLCSAPFSTSMKESGFPFQKALALLCFLPDRSYSPYISGVQLSLALYNLPVAGK